MQLKHICNGGEYWTESDQIRNDISASTRVLRIFLEIMKSFIAVSTTNDVQNAKKNR